MIWRAAHSSAPTTGTPPRFAAGWMTARCLQDAGPPCGGQILGATWPMGSQLRLAAQPMTGAIQAHQRGWSRLISPNASFADVKRKTSFRAPGGFRARRPPNRCPLFGLPKQRSGRNTLLASLAAPAKSARVYRKESSSARRRRRPCSVTHRLRQHHEPAVLNLRQHALPYPAVLFRGEGHPVAEDVGVVRDGLHAPEQCIDR